MNKPTIPILKTSQRRYQCPSSPLSRCFGGDRSYLLGLFLLWYVVVVVPMVTATNGNGSNNNDNKYNRYGQYDPEKQQPDKGDPSCTSLEDWLQAIEQGSLPESMLPPCRDVGDDSTNQWDEDHDDDDDYDDFEDELPDWSPPLPPPMDGCDGTDDTCRGPPQSDESTSSSSSQPKQPPVPSGVCYSEGCNSFRFHLYVGTMTRAKLQSLGHIIKPAMTTYLNVAQSQYNYFIDRPPSTDADADADDDIDDDDDADDDDDDDADDTDDDDDADDTSFLAYALGLVEELLGNFHPDAVAHLFLVLADPRVIYEDGQETWWRYRFQYNCHYAAPESSDAPIVDKTQLAQIRNDTRQVLQDGINLGALQQAMLFEAGYELPFDITLQLTRPETVGVDLPEGAMAAQTPPEGDLPVPPSPEDSTSTAMAPTASPVVVATPAMPDSEVLVYNEPLDVTEWDWRRYLGLGLLLGTVLGTVVLTQVAEYRRRKRDCKDLWGNLATEEGVDELLRTGWKITGSKMEIYDKKGVGYKEGDSILIGGFEQREVVGAEITITQPESEATPETTAMP